MSKFIKNAVKNIQISGIRSFNQLASSTPGVIKLTIGELDLNTPMFVKERAIQSILNNQTRYTSNAGLETLRSKLSKKYLTFTKDEFIITVGTTEALSIIIKSIIEPNNEVIIPSPGYVGYEPLIALEGGKVSLLDTTKSDFRITREGLEKAYNNNVKALIITNPNNPTGTVLSPNEMSLIGAFVLEKDILLIADEIYADTLHNFISFGSYLELKNNLILLNGFSKSHAMTGFRVGYLAASKELVDQFIKVHQYSVTSAPSISQFAALAAVKEKYAKLPEELSNRRDYLIEKLEPLGFKSNHPKGAFYLFLDISNFGLISEEFCLKLLEEEKVALVPGEYFLGNHKDYVRLSYAADFDTLKEAVTRIKRFVNRI